MLVPAVGARRVAAGYQRLMHAATSLPLPRNTAICREVVTPACCTSKRSYTILVHQKVSGRRLSPPPDMAQGAVTP